MAEKAVTNMSKLYKPGMMHKSWQLRSGAREGDDTATRVRAAMDRYAWLRIKEMVTDIERGRPIKASAHIARSMFKNWLTTAPEEFILLGANIEANFDFFEEIVLFALTNGDTNQSSIGGANE